MKILLPTLWVLLVLGALEAAGGWWLNEHGSPYDKARGILRPDSELGWRQRENLDTTFEGEPLATNSLGWRAPELALLPTGAKLRVLVLGPASAFGWGVSAGQTYAAEVERLLRAHGDDAVVLNAGEIGFSTFQGRMLSRLPEVAAFHPTHVLIAYGVNDVDRNRFYFQSNEPDSRALAAPQPAGQVKTYRLVSRSSLLTILYRLAGELNGSGEFREPAVRVPPADFAANLRALADEAQRLGARVAFLGTAVNLPVYTAQASDIESKLAARFDQAVALYRHRDSETARLLFEELAKLRPQWNEPYYYLAAIARAKGQSVARAYEDRALLSEPYRIHRDVLAYNETMKATAREVGAAFVDLYAELVDEKKEAQFLDPFHPTALGHARIARAVARDFFKIGEAARRR